jgi:hypothetical protein
VILEEEPGHAHARDRLHVLGNDPHLQVGSAHDAPVGGLLLPGEKAHERGLAGPVRTDESDLPAGKDFTADVLEDVLRAVVLADVVECDHAREI